MNNSGFGAGWTLLGRLWCACWRGAKGTSCSHLSWCTAWGRFLSHKFFKISGFGWICTSFPNLSLKIRTDSCFSWQWIIQVLQKHPWRYQQLLEVGFMETNITKHHRNSQGFRWGHLPIPSTFLRKFWISDLDPEANSCGQIEPRTLVDFGSQTKILEEKLCLNLIISFKKTIEARIPRSKRQNRCNLKIYAKLYCLRGSGCFETLDFQVGTTHWAREGAIREGCWGSRGMEGRLLKHVERLLRRWNVSECRDFFLA